LRRLGAGLDWGPDLTAASAEAHAVLVVNHACRAAIRALRPLTWAVLVDVTLDGVRVDGAWVAPSSARRVAANLGVDPGTAARALRTLRDRELVVLERGATDDGRFGLSAYRLGEDPGGLSLLAPCGHSPHVVGPCVDRPHMVYPHGILVGGVDRAADRTASGVPPAEGRRRLERPADPTRRRPVSQGALDLGLENK
jgi:hypothetical protein